MLSLNIKKNTLILAAAAMLGGGIAHAAKLDLTSDVGVKAVSISNINFATQNPGGDFFYLQNASLGIAVKDLHPKKASDMTMDVYIKLQAYGIAGSTVAKNAPYDAIAERFPNSNFTPYMENAYMRVTRLFDTNLTFKAGRMPYILATGLTLCDDNMGFTGFTLASERLFNLFDLEFFTFQPKASDSKANSVNLLGASVKIPAEGIWEFYNYWEFDKNPGKAAANVAISGRTLQFTGLSYSLKYGFLTFKGEGVMQTGSAIKTNSSEQIKYNASALLLSGKWVQPFGQFGTGEVRITYGRGSGDKNASPDMDEAFFPDYGHRYSGLERSGYGELFAASLYDAFGGDPTTKTGMPAGLSGIQVVNMGITMPSYRNVFLDVDYYSYEADRAVGASKKLGTELDFRLTYPIGQAFSINAVYAAFSPGSAYPAGTSSAKKFALEALARF
jgi:hypothetical protein